MKYTHSCRDCNHGLVVADDKPPAFCPYCQGKNIEEVSEPDAKTGKAKAEKADATDEEINAPHKGKK